MINGVGFPRRGAQAAGVFTDEVGERGLLRLVNAIGIAAERVPSPADNANLMLTIVMRGLRAPA
ncbi:MAG: hypothetical protein ACRDP6_46275 [Actinoallomurus sp.]